MQGYHVLTYAFAMNNIYSPANNFDRHILSIFKISLKHFRNSFLLNTEYGSYRTMFSSLLFIGWI
jgi:hypothetical protein